MHLYLPFLIFIFNIYSTEVRYIPVKVHSISSIFFFFYFFISLLHYLPGKFYVHIFVAILIQIKGFYCVLYYYILLYNLNYNDIPISNLIGENILLFGFRLFGFFGSLFKVPCSAGLHYNLPHAILMVL